MTSLDTAESLLCAALRGTPDVWRALREPGQQTRVLQAATQHRVRPLLAWRLRERGEWPSWPESIRQALQASERAEAVIEIARRRELARLLGAFGAAGIPVLLLKGAAFAYALYPEPWLRPRQDTDLLVSPDRVVESGDLLERTGYQPDRAMGGELVSHQRNYVRRDTLYARHDCDLHWKPLNPVALADLLSFDDLLRDGYPVPLGDGHVARMAKPVHALLLACLHRASHHYDSGDLLWLHDIHLLAERLSALDHTELIELARRTGAGAICARGLRLSRDRFETRLPVDLLDRLETPGDALPLPLIYLTSDVRKADLLRADLAAIPDWRRRVRLLREHVFPPADYMLRGSGRSRWLLLPVLYAWRIVRGARGWFRPL